MHNEYRLPGNEDLVRALEFFSHEREEEALAVVDGFLEREPSNPVAYRAKSMIYAGLERYDEAKTLIERAIELSHGSSGSQFLELGELLMQLNQFDQAIEAISTATTLLNQGGETYMLDLAKLALAVATFQSGKIDFARQRAQEVDDNVSYYYCDELWSRSVLMERLAGI